MPVKVVALDFDGVILESNEAKTQAFAEFAASHGPAASSAMVMFHRENLGVSRFVKFQWFYRAVLQREATSADLAACNDRFSSLCLESVTASPFVPGAEQFILKYFRVMPLYIVSSTPEEELTRIVAKRNLSCFFQAVLGTPGTKIEHLQNIMQREQITPDCLLMVGDSQTDLNAAKAAGAKFYGRGLFDSESCADNLHKLGNFIVNEGNSCLR